MAGSHHVLGSTPSTVESWHGGAHLLCQHSGRRRGSEVQEGQPELRHYLRKEKNKNFPSKIKTKCLRDLVGQEKTKSITEPPLPDSFLITSLLSSVTGIYLPTYTPTHRPIHLSVHLSSQPATYPPSIHSTIHSFIHILTHANMHQSLSEQWYVLGLE